MNVDEVEVEEVVEMTAECTIANVRARQTNSNLNILINYFLLFIDWLAEVFILRNFLF